MCVREGGERGLCPPVLGGSSPSPACPRTLSIIILPRSPLFHAGKLPPARLPLSLSRAICGFPGLIICNSLPSPLRHSRSSPPPPPSPDLPPPLSPSPPCNPLH